MMKRRDLKPGAVAKARNLRRSSTAEERILWQTLRRSAAAAKFRRQVPIGLYFVDFASHSAKLVIELDGGHHAFQQGYDEERTRFLQGEGYRVMRFWNRDVAENLDGVFSAIEAELKKLPSPLVGEGGAKRRMRGDPSSSNPSPSRNSPSPLVGEGGAKRRMRGEHPKTPHPIPLPQGERGSRPKSAISES
jgi:very-short-patch-repair endonuclease